LGISSLQGWPRSGCWSHRQRKDRGRENSMKKRGGNFLVESIRGGFGRPRKRKEEGKGCEEVEKGKFPSSHQGLP